MPASMEDDQADGLAPTFAKKPTIEQAPDGKRLTFACRVLADPRPTLSWFRDGVQVQDSARHKMKVEKDGKSYSATLEIRDATVDDAGKYKVIAKNELGESNATIGLNFNTEEPPAQQENVGRPSFTEKPVIRQAADGSSVTFECRLTADPQPSMQWYHKSTLIKESSRHKMSITTESKLKYKASLQIFGIQASDGGEYKAVAKNKNGEGSASINLNIAGDEEEAKEPSGGAPRFPKKPTIRQEGDDLVMACVMEANPMPVITWYHGTKVVTASSRLRIASKETSKDTYLLTLTVSSPTQEDGGNYRCNARNKIGESNANIALNFQASEEP
ncbi:disorganized muscle protein 1-like [Pollicipes pollicipes]|uniref:disorganized muscle protein 1-like n=1 Tax=Pollicipes pollicipes TaxID=41117 RepID=UPI001884B377|nr:disorganized muscle protein 1-like [Pollicipes pollicipes]